MQWKAIVEEGDNILVSAGAGSGKTAVLTERILEKLKAGIDLSELVVLTFTNAAAREMKDRVYRKILQEIESGNIDLEEQLNKIDSSLITTFDSYCMFLVQKYYYKLGVGKNPKILDKLFISQKKKELITEIFEELFLSGNQEFLNLIDTYTNDSDEELKDVIIKMHMSYVQTMNKGSIDSHYTDEYFKSLLEFFLNDLQNSTKIIASKIKELDIINTDESLTGYITQNNMKFQSLIHATTYKQFVDAVALSKEFKVRKPIKNKLGDINDVVEEIKNVIKKEYDAICKKVKYQSEKEMRDIYFSTQEYSKTIEKLINIFNDRLFEYKHQINSFEYIDINLLVVKLLKENKDVQMEIVKTFNEILVDEYQDTNDIQELCLMMISNGNNVYAVGDIKQAIYGFRNANPDNFREKYLKYQKQEGGILIDLNKNFRSRKEVLDNINLFFERLIDERIGGVNYDQNQRLEFGNATYEKYNPTHDNNMKVYTYSKTFLKNEKIAQDVFEVEMIAKDIQAKIKGNYQVYDEKIKGLRNCQLSDFAILTETKKRHALILEIFEKYKLDVLISDFNESFISSKEIVLIKNILKIIHSLNNYSYAYKNVEFAVMSFMRSFLFEIDDDIIDRIMVKIRDDIKENGFDKAEFINSFEKTMYEPLMRKILIISNNSKTLSLYGIINEIISGLGIIVKIKRLNAVISAESNLYSVLQKGQNFDDAYLNVEDFINYLDNIKVNHDFNKVSVDLDSDLESNTETEHDAVNVMTIHKSKGLEFAICYFPFFFSKFNTTAHKEKKIYDKDLMFLLRGVNSRGNLIDTVLFDVYKQKLTQESIGEKLRVLYVALTRAKEQMIFYLNTDNDKNINGEKLSDNNRLSANNYEHYLSNLSNVLSDYYESLDYKFLNISEKSERLKEQNTVDFDIEFLDFQCDFEEQKSEKASMSKHELLGKEKITSINYGNELHQKLEFIDFNNLENEIQKADKEIQGILRNIEKVVNNDEAKYYSEYQFQYRNEDRIITGIIDLLVETENQIIIIDYKLRDIDKPEYEQQLKTYKDYMNKISNKKVEMYLLAIISNKIKKIN